jgi:hypothetical protein
MRLSNGTTRASSGNAANVSFNACTRGLEPKPGLPQA